MKKMFDKKIIYGVIIGIIITSSIGALAANYLYMSEDVSYNGAQPNVEKALNELYDNNKNKSGVPSEIAKDTNGNNAEIHYYGARISSVTKTFRMNKGKYMLFVYTTYNRWWDGTNVGGDTTNQTIVTITNGTAAKINDYAYIINVNENNTEVNVKINSYGNDENQRTIYEICFYN